MSGFLVLWWAATVGGSEVLTLEARLGEAELAAGSEHELVVTAALAAGWAPSTKDLVPVLQIDVPEGVELLGETHDTIREQARNEFLTAPFERILEMGAQPVAFRVTEVPADDAVLALNVVAYLHTEEEQAATFLRRRFELPLKPGAAAREVPATSSRWGRGDFLQIGDEASSFELPRADGSFLLLDELLYKKDILITTYRAHW